MEETCGEAGLKRDIFISPRSAAESNGAFFVWFGVVWYSFDSPSWRLFGLDLVAWEDSKIWIGKNLSPGGDAGAGNKRSCPSNRLVLHKKKKENLVEQINIAIPIFYFAPHGDAPPPIVRHVCTFKYEISDPYPCFALGAWM